jgi:hypothetical protein
MCRFQHIMCRQLSQCYLKLVGMAIWLLKLRFEIQLAVIMACTHNAKPTQGDLVKGWPTSRELLTSDLLGLRMKDQSSSPPVSQPLPSIPSLVVVNCQSPSASAPTTPHSTSSRRSRPRRFPSIQLIGSTTRSPSRRRTSSSTVPT